MGIHPANQGLGAVEWSPGPQGHHPHQFEGEKGADRTKDKQRPGHPPGVRQENMPPDLCQIRPVHSSRLHQLVGDLAQTDDITQHGESQIGPQPRKHDSPEGGLLITQPVEVHGAETHPPQRRL